MDTLPRRQATEYLRFAHQARRVGRAREAEHLCRMAVALEPGLDEAHNLLGVIRAGDGRLPEARDSLARAVRRRPEKLRWRLSLANVCVRMGRQAEGVEHLEEILERDPLMPEAHAALQAARQSVMPQWHFAMLADEARNAAYRKAIETVVGPGDVVLDIGAGSGLLSLMAARSGARQVVAVEAQPLIADCARRAVRQHGLEERVSVVTGHSSLLRLGRDLPRRADVLVTETFDSGLLGEGILDTLEHARKYLLRPGARVIPAGAEILCQLIESESLHAEAAAGRVGDMDLSEVNRYAPLYLERFLSRHPFRRLSGEVGLFGFDFGAAGPSWKRESSVGIEVDRDGTCHALARRFRLRLAPGVDLESGTDPRGAHWAHVVRMLVPPVPVRERQTVEVRAAHDGRFVAMDLTR